MITLHHCVSARSFRPLWMLEEIGLPYELKMLPFPPRVLARSYLDVNPLGTVPAGERKLATTWADYESAPGVGFPTAAEAVMRKFWVRHIFSSFVHI